MSKGPIYRIRVEIIGEEAKDFEIGGDMKDGIECRGFTIIADMEDKSAVVMHNVSNMDVAQAIAGNRELMIASTLARVLRECKRIIPKDGEDDSADSKEATPE